MVFVFRILNHYFEKGTPWVELDKIKQRSWFLSVDIEDDEVVPCYDTVSELRLSKAAATCMLFILPPRFQCTRKLQRRFGIQAKAGFSASRIAYRPAG